MFDNIRNAFSNAAKSFSEKQLNEKDIENILSELEISLLESDVASEVIDVIRSDLSRELIGSKVDRKTINKFVKDSMISSISALFDAVDHVSLLEKINTKKTQAQPQPFLILFVGINGTGKTTTLAKIAHMLQQAKYSVVVAASDTFRAGAIEQLREHTNRLNLKLVAQNYNSDPAAVARDAILYAKSHKTDCVLIDTAGRMQTSKNLMEQIEKITKVVNPDMKIFVGDSLAGSDTVNQAREFFERVKFDGSILTKIDADAKGGAALSIVKITSTPILYVGTGQEYPDLKPFDKDIFLEAVFGSLDDVEMRKIDVSVPQSPEPAPAIDATPPVPETKPPEPAPAIDATPPVPETKPPEPAPAIDATPPVPETKPPEPAPAIDATPPVPETKPPEPAPAIDATPPVPETKPPEPAPAIDATPPVPETKPPEPAPAIETKPFSDDPFEGINDDDISTYSDLFDVSPPDNDDDAHRLAKNIRKWIIRGRPKSSESSDTDNTNNLSVEDTHTHDDTKTVSQLRSQQLPPQEEKPKKKRGMFGFFRK